MKDILAPPLGDTPLMTIEGVHCKLECVNPTGSVKDRIAAYILERSQELGLLRPGMTIVEATSGNTGIALARYGRLAGFSVSIVMPEHMTEERKRIIRSFSAELVLCSREGSFGEAVRIRDEMAQEPDVFCPDQFSNPLNAECHFRTTGQELLDSMPGPIDAFVAGVGTGGTLMGVGLAIKEAFPNAKIVAVEPAESAVMSGRPAGEHGIYGIGDGFIPDLVGDGKGGLHPAIDEICVIDTEAAVRSAKRLQEEHGLCVGTSSGANFLAASELQGRYRNIATILPDGFAKYRCQGLVAATDPVCPFKRLCPAPPMTEGKLDTHDSSTR